MSDVRSSTKRSRRAVLGGMGAIGAGLSTLGFPAIVRAQQTKQILKPIVAGLNAKAGDPSYESIARIPKILLEKYNIKAAWTPASLALHTQAVLQGAFILAKAKGSADIAAASVDHLRRYITLLFQQPKGKAQS